MAIGCSTGGPEALVELLQALPLDFPAPILLAQHLPRAFEGNLAASLQARSGYPVENAGTTTLLKPGCVFLAPTDHDLVVDFAGGLLGLVLRPAAETTMPHPNVDLLFCSLAGTVPTVTTAVVLSGMGRDGVEGCINLAGAGGRILVQDEKSSVVWGMAGSVHALGLADACLCPKEIAMQLVHEANVSTTTSHSLLG